MWLMGLLCCVFEDMWLFHVYSFSVFFEEGFFEIVVVKNLLIVLYLVHQEDFLRKKLKYRSCLLVFIGESHFLVSVLF